MGAMFPRPSSKWDVKEEDVKDPRKKMMFGVNGCGSSLGGGSLLGGASHLGSGVNNHMVSKSLTIGLLPFQMA